MPEALGATTAWTKSIKRSGGSDCSVTYGSPGTLPIALIEILRFAVEASTASYYATRTVRLIAEPKFPVCQSPVCGLVEAGENSRSVFGSGARRESRQTGVIQ